MGAYTYTTQTSKLTPWGDILGADSIPADIRTQIQAYRNGEVSGDKVRKNYLKALNDFKYFSEYTEPFVIIDFSECPSFEDNEKLDFTEADMKFKEIEKQERAERLLKYGEYAGYNKTRGTVYYLENENDTELSSYEFRYDIGDYDENKSGLYNHISNFCDYMEKQINSGENPIYTAEEINNTKKMLDILKPYRVMRMPKDYSNKPENIENKNINIIEQKEPLINDTEKSERFFIVIKRKNDEELTAEITNKEADGINTLTYDSRDNYESALKSLNSLMYDFENHGMIYEKVDEMLSRYTETLSTEKPVDTGISEETAAILRDGGNKNGSVYRIIARYMKGCYTAEENAEFLKNEYMKGGKGFNFNGNMVSVWFNESGMTIGGGKSALSARGKNKLTWFQIGQHINNMLDNGTFAPQEVIDRSIDFEKNELAEKICHLHSDIEKEYKFINPEIIYHGFPEAKDNIIKMLSNPDDLIELMNGFKEFCKNFNENNSILNYKNSYKPNQLLRRIEDLFIDGIKFEANEIPENNFTRFITDDEIDNFIINHVGDKYAIYSFFLHDNTIQEKEKFLKDKFGGSYSGSTHALSGADDSNSLLDTKGIHLSRGKNLDPYDSVNISWNKAAQIIDGYISSERYMTENELNRLPKYEMAILARNVFSFFNNFDYQKEQHFKTGYEDYNDVKFIEDMLYDTEDVYNILGAMEKVIESTSRNDKHYDERLEYYYNLRAFRDGTFTLFPKNTVTVQQNEQLNLFLETIPEHKTVSNSKRHSSKKVNKKFASANILETVKTAIFDLYTGNARDGQYGEDYDWKFLREEYQAVFNNNCKGFYNKVADNLYSSDADNILLNAYNGNSDTVEDKEYENCIDCLTLILNEYRNELNPPKYVKLSKESDVLENELPIEDLTDNFTDKINEKLIETVGESIENVQELYDKEGYTVSEESAQNHQETEPIKPFNFRIIDDKLGEGSAKTKYNYNIKAIKTLKQIENEQRFATPDEQEILSRYVGWGGIPEVFDRAKSDWEKEYSELKAILTADEYKKAAGSVLNAHYTSPEVIKAIYTALESIGVSNNMRILEPADGRSVASDALK